MTFYLKDKRKCDVTDTFFILDYESEALFQNLTQCFTFTGTGEAAWVTEPGETQQIRGQIQTQSQLHMSDC